MPDFIDDTPRLLKQEYQLGFRQVFAVLRIVVANVDKDPVLPYRRASAGGAKMHSIEDELSRIQEMIGVYRVRAASYLRSTGGDSPVRKSEHAALVSLGHSLSDRLHVVTHMLEDQD